MPVNTPCAEYEAAKPKWKRLRDCHAGRDAILAAGQEYLPALPGNPTGYDQYAKRGNFLNATARTVEGLAGAIHQKAPTVDAPARIKDILADVTPRGNVPFELLAAKATREVLTVGRLGILVDMPADESPETRPYAVLCKAEDVLSWRLDRRGADEVLTRVVLRETEDKPDTKDPFVSKRGERYRVCELVDGVYTQTTWTPKDDSGKEFVAGETLTPMRRGTSLDFIPFVFVGPASVTPDIEKPPLEDLADVNIAHWRNSVDHEYGLHLVALPTPWVSGVKSEDSTAKKIGPSVVWELETGGQAGMLEFTGQGLAAIRAAMVEKKKEMATLGARLLEEQPSGVETATAVGMRHSGDHATLRTVAQAIEQALSQVIRWLAWWTGTETAPADVKASVELNKEFFAVKASPDEVRAALLAWQAGGIAFETFYERLQKGGWSREGVTAEEERQAIEAETPEVPEPLQDPENPATLPEPTPQPGAPPPRTGGAA